MPPIYKSVIQPITESSHYRASSNFQEKRVDRNLESSEDHTMSQPPSTMHFESRSTALCESLIIYEYMFGRPYLVSMYKVRPITNIACNVKEDDGYFMHAIFLMVRSLHLTVTTNISPILAKEDRLFTMICCML